MGDRLQRELRQLQNEYPLLVKEIRGRGLMLGVELDLLPFSDNRTGMMALLEEQGLLLYVVVSFCSMSSTSASPRRLPTALCCVSNLR